MHMSERCISHGFVSSLQHPHQACRRPFCWKHERMSRHHQHKVRTIEKRACHRAVRIRLASILIVFLVTSCQIARTTESAIHSASDNRPKLEQYVKKEQQQRLFNINSNIIDKLTKFGYLPESDPEMAELRSATHMHSVVKLFQKFAALPQTGLIDAETSAQFDKSRCGLPDIALKKRRVRRYAIQGQRWTNTNITWTIKDLPSLLHMTRVYHQLKTAFEIWSSTSLLKFHYVHNGKADVVITFHGKDYGYDKYSFDGKGGVVGHAFFPGIGIGGDVHFDEDEIWSLGERTPYNKTNLFSVALHEIGHSLGLGHSSRKESIMFPWYRTMAKDIKLAIDDKLGLHNIYGPRATEEWLRKQNAKNKPKPKQKPLPNICKVQYDAASVIRGDLFIFSGRYFWRIKKNASTKPVAILIKRFWYGLPPNLTRIDAIYERPHDQRIMIFIGKHYWLFSSNKADADYPQPLTQLGISDSIANIDAAYVWGHNKKTYFFKHNIYWRFSEASSRVVGDYPRQIKIWKGVPASIDSAFVYNRVTYFVKGSRYWQFNDRFMSAEDNGRPLSSARWTTCPIEAEKQQYPGELKRLDSGAETSATSIVIFVWTSVAISLWTANNDRWDV